MGKQMGTHERASPEYAGDEGREQEARVVRPADGREGVQNCLQRPKQRQPSPCTQQAKP